MALKIFNTHISSPTPFEIILHGNLPSGRSIQVNIPNYELYFYIKLEEINIKLTKELCDIIKEAIYNQKYPNFSIKNIEIIKKTNIYGYFKEEDFIKISYTKNENIKIRNKFSSSNKVKEFLESGFSISLKSLIFKSNIEYEKYSKNPKVLLKFKTFEHSVAPVTRFMTDRKINGMQYVKIEDYNIIEGEEIIKEEIENSCICGNINYDYFNPEICNEFYGFIDYNDNQDKCKIKKCDVLWGTEELNNELSKSMLSICHKHTIKFPKNKRIFIETKSESIFPIDDAFYPPLKIMSYDIETPAESRSFAHPSTTEVKQIGITLKINLQNKNLINNNCEFCKEFNKLNNNIKKINKENNIEVQTIFTYGSIKRLNSTNVYCFKEEINLLESFINYVQFIDPDVLIGYNINDFDTWYIDERCKLLKIPFNIGRQNIKLNKEEQYIPKVIGLTINKEELKDSFIEYNKKENKKLIYTNYGENFKEFLKKKYIFGKDLNFREVIKFNSSIIKNNNNIFHESVNIKESTFSSMQMGTRNLNLINIHGRINFDLLVLLRKTHKLSSYTLNSVSSYFLNSQKLDIDHNMVLDMMLKNPNSRTNVAKYCLQDTFLPLKIFNKLSMLISTSELVRVCGVPLEYHLSRGVSIKVFHLLLRKANELGYILPDITRNNLNDIDTYEGAIVIEPERGYYEEPVAVLDFASLYPSIIIANNICYSTFLDENRIKKSLNYKEKSFKFQSNKLEIKQPILQNSETTALFYKKLSNEDINILKDKKCLVNLFSSKIDNEELEFCITPSNNHFVTKKHRLGILPQILTYLLTERKAVKKQMHNTKDQQLRDILNARQDALKLCANSIYGFTGATVGQLPNLNISSSVTSFGREMIEMTKYLSETILKREGYNGRVIYGDTDSVMIKIENFFNNKKLRDFYNEIKNSVESKRCKKYEGDKFFSKECECIDHLIDEKPDLNSLAILFRICKSLSEEVSTHFLNPIKLEFEKVYWPYLLIAKKRYAGVMYCGREVKECKIDYSAFEKYNIRDNNNKVEKKYTLKSLNYLSKECFNNVKVNKIDTKGIETVRRDNCKLVRIVLTKCLDLLLLKRDVNSACDLVKKTVSDLYSNKIDLSLLVITKQLSKTNYTNKQPHVVLAEKLMKRDPGTAPGLGDRVPFVIIKDPILSSAASAGRIKSSRDIKVCDKAEDPLYVLENDLQIDVDYYIEQQLSNPIHRLFSAICDSSKLLINEGKIEIKKSIVKNKIFGKRKDVCLECKKAGTILCKECIEKGGLKTKITKTNYKEKEEEYNLEYKIENYNKVEYIKTPSEIYDKHLNKIKEEIEEEKIIFGKCWSECQRCFSDRMNEVLCTNQNCDIFFMRVKAKKEVINKEKILKKLKNLKW